MKSTFKEVFGSSLPIIQAPMAGFQGSELAIAVANAGGVGSLACATLGPDKIKRELKAVSDNSNKNSNINFFATECFISRYQQFSRCREMADSTARKKPSCEKPGFLRS